MQRCRSEWPAAGGTPLEPETATGENAAVPQVAVNTPCSGLQRPREFPVETYDGNRPGVVTVWPCPDTSAPRPSGQRSSSLGAASPGRFQPRFAPAASFVASARALITHWSELSYSKRPKRPSGTSPTESIQPSAALRRAWYCESNTT